MKIHCIRHEPFEGLGNIELWARENNHHLEYTRTYLHQSYPDEAAFDMLIIMGGTASIYENNLIPWLADEKNFISKAIRANKKILGICLGAQLLADIFGAKVYKAPAKEIGWFPVLFNINEIERYSFFPSKITAFHWHGDTFDLPEGALRIASSELTPNQGFVIQNNIMALQFHLEMNSSALKKIIKAMGNELCEGGKFVQPADVILAQAAHLATCNQLMLKILEEFATNVVN
jgi:GMP synthase-like glutamine amidotransferase